MENPVQPPTKPERNWKKILLFLLIGLFLISLVGVGIYLLIPKPIKEPSTLTKPQKQATQSAKKDETEGWKTFIGTPSNNSKYKYSFKHPQNTKVYTFKSDKDVSLSNDILVTNDTGSTPTLKTNSIFLRLFVANQSSSKSFGELVNEVYNSNKKSSKSVSPLEKTQFAGKTAYSFEMTASSTGCFEVINLGYCGQNVLGNKPLKVVIVTIDNQTIFNIVFKTNDIFEKLLSTFKFLD